MIISAALFPFLTLVIIGVLFAVQNLHAAFLLVFTDPGSRSRVLGTVSLCYFCWKSYGFIHHEFPLLPLKATLEPGIFIHCLNSIRILFLVGKGSVVYCRTSSTDQLRQLATAFMLMGSPRGINTPWQIRVVPSFPSCYNHPTRIFTRKRFLVRQVLITAWLLLMTHAMMQRYCSYSTLERQHIYGEGAEWRFRGATPRQLAARLEGAVGYLAYAQGKIDSIYRILSIVHVGLGLSNPEEWPPLFGSIWDAYSIGRFWGIYWHQLLRGICVSFAQQLTRCLESILGPRDYIRVLSKIAAFALSGILHAPIGLSASLNKGNIGTIVIPFILFGMAVVGETMVFSVFASYWSRKTTAVGPMLRVGGYIWVLCSWCVICGWWLAPILRYMDSQNVDYGVLCLTRALGGWGTGALLALGMLIGKVFLGTSL